jgi:tetratricopeptide (TPR) repeat protein
MKKIFLFLLITQISFAQKDGFWDKERAFTKEVKLSSGNRTLVKIDDLPEGASEFVFRISLIDENGKITNSLASVLKAIPDPTGISQGAAGALFLTNSLSGDDTCVYGIYTSEKAGNQFLKDGKLETACYFSKEPINKDSKVISIKNTKCFENTPNIWFAFENKNWVLSTKIVLEVVSWIDYKASRGWTKHNKKELEAEITRLNFVNSLTKKEIFLGELINLITDKYKFNEFKDFLSSEKTNIIQNLSLQAIQNTKQMHDFLEFKRKTAWDFYKKGEYQKAISFIQDEIIENKWAQAKDYSALGDIYIETKQFIVAKESYFKATELDSNHLWYQLKYANALVFNDELSEAKEIHKKYKSNNIDAKTSWTQQAKFDVAFYKSKGLNVDDFKKILRILE